MTEATIRIRHPRGGRAVCTCSRDALGEWTVEPPGPSPAAQRHADERKRDMPEGLRPSGPTSSAWWAAVWPEEKTRKPAALVLPTDDSVMFYSRDRGPRFSIGLRKLGKVLDAFVAAGRRDVDLDTLRRAVDHHRH